MSVFSNEKVVGVNNNIAPTIFQSSDHDDWQGQDIGELEGQGWKFHNGKDKAWVNAWGEDNNGTMSMW